ncbi:MAG: YqiJ family protein [bacterium]|nr:YqiJ family protein [bacterium]
MIEFILADSNSAFAIALGLMVLIGGLELAGALIGIGFSDLLGNLIPDIDIDGDLDGDASSLGHILGWLRIDKVPVIILIIVFLTAFGVSGYFVQWFIFTSTGHYLPIAAASLIAGVCSLPAVRFFGGIFSRLMPKDESSAVSHDSLIGRSAVIIQGVARIKAGVQARVVDSHGKTHYVMVEPEDEGSEFAAGEKVLLISRSGALFKAIAEQA